MSKQAVANLAKKKESIQVFSKERLDKQHINGKLTARERILVLLDNESFEEFGCFVEHRSTNFDLEKQKIPSDGVITGYGTIYGRPVFVFSQDFTSVGGSLGEMHAKKIVSLQKKAIENRIPIIGINDSGGARIQEGIDSLAGYGDIFQNNILASGYVPQISIIMGPCAGGAVYSPALTDFTVMVNDSSYMFVTGPNVVASVMNEQVTSDTLGGADVHAKISGVADLVYNNDIEAIEQVRNLFAFLPLSNHKDEYKVPTDDNIGRKIFSLDTIVPENNSLAYNMVDILTKIVDNNDFFQLQEHFAKNIITGFGRIAGYTVGIVANQPMELAGCLDIKASRKAARFVRFCDAFNIPIVSFVDVPGFLPGTAQEHDGIIKHGAKLLYAYGEATVPKITIITRKSYGGAYIVMGSKHLGSDIVYAWPTAEIAVLGSTAAAEILFRKKYPNKAEYKQKTSEYEAKFCNPYFAASRGYIDDIIKPHDTRLYIAKSLELLKNKSTTYKIIKKHDNLPL